MNQVILLDDGWKRLKEGGVQKIEQILENVQGGDYKSGITTEEYSTLYTTVYTMCTQKPPNNWASSCQPRSPLSRARSTERRASRLTAQPHLRPACFVTDPAAHMRIRVAYHVTPPRNRSQHLYNNYCDAVKDYLSARILPRIKEKHDEAMLKELVRRWENHKLMIKFLARL